MSGPIAITSSTHLNTVLGTHVVVVADFHATWCGPCKAIAPVFEQLAATHTKPKKVAFVKIDVDAHPDIAGQYGVSAMPTFLIFHNRTVATTIRGANPSALRSAVTEACAKAGSGAGTAATPAFQSRGHVLGTGAAPAPSLGGWAFALRRTGLLGTLVRFVGLYFASLLSLDAYAGAQASPFAVAGAGAGRR